MEEGTLKSAPLWSPVAIQIVAQRSATFGNEGSCTIMLERAKAIFFIKLKKVDGLNRQQVVNRFIIAEISRLSSQESALYEIQIEI